CVSAISIRPCAEPADRIDMMDSPKFVTPVKTGVQPLRNSPKTLDSGFRRNDEMSQFLIFFRVHLT
ncbi:MAG: hypothetical protein KJ555_02305, partial [Proteobacteria bacterium]|nr:hypothetical protein [Pseudomonadota bacterium]